jgi:hypothetical protein
MRTIGDIPCPINEVDKQNGNMGFSSKDKEKWKGKIIEKLNAK